MPKSTTWDKRLYFPSEGRRAEDFFSPEKSDGFGITEYLEEMWCERAKLIEGDRKYEDSRLQGR
jgi:hypothetical protein